MLQYPVDAVIGYHNNFGCCFLQYPVDAVIGYHNNFGCCVLSILWMLLLVIIIILDVV